MKKLSGALALAMLLTSCSQPMTNRERGAVTGGILGGLLGTQIGSGSGRTAAILGGSVIGAMVGASMADSLDENNRHELSRALATLPAHRSHSWVDHSSGYHYTITPIKSFHRGATLCRRYNASVIINGQVRHAVGRACQHSTNNWYIVD